MHNNVFTLTSDGRSISRVVILGGGFISQASRTKFEERGVDVTLIRSRDVDLTQENAAERLKSLLQPSDSVVFVAARAPVKSEAMLIENLLMAKSVCEALKSARPQHLTYISSDAVYADSDMPLNETSVCSPDNLHGIMHLTREVMLKQIIPDSLCVLRPTLVFGENDPHNGYGPNKFLRLAAAQENIALFGEGEECRDHVWIEDVAEVIMRAVLHKAQGVLNVVSGSIVSFKEIAETVVTHTDTTSKVLTTPRTSPMPHKGYREFNNSSLTTAFPDLKMTNVLQWIRGGR